MHRREVGERPRRQRAVELAERPRRRQVARALDLRALELAPQERLEAAQLIARQPLAARVIDRQVRLRLGAQSERAADPLDVDADHARALLAARERCDRHPREVAHRALGAVAHGRRDLGAQRLELLVGQLVEDRAIVLAHALADGGELDGAEEEALEDELEDAPVLLTLGERRGERLAEVGLLGPHDLAQHGERVEQLRGADRDAFAAQLLAELEHARRQALGRDRGRAGRALRRHRPARRA